MGATKRLAELIVLELQSRYARTSFGAVRFGNVLGSNGSVLPVFKRQIQAGKPLTVTHPETTRYFMTVPEAVQLILQASILPDLRGHIAMLDMGDPVRITDLAVNLLRLSGLANTRKHIVYTGLRPGEKLHEELCAPDEEAFETSVSKVRILKTDLGFISRACVHVEAWEENFREGRGDEVVHALMDMFPGLAGTDITRSLDITEPASRQGGVRVSV
jgi:FlaA1/EpsC-like NDP-sugar epimerase